MGSIVVYTAGSTDDAARRAGMTKLGNDFNTAQQTGMTAKQIVDSVIEGLVDSASWDVYYQNYKVFRATANGPLKFNDGTRDRNLVLQGRKDNSATATMHIAVPDGNNDIITANNYLSKAITDVGGTDTTANQAYLLGTVTFRRCV